MRVPPHPCELPEVPTGGAPRWLCRTCGQRWYAAVQRVMTSGREVARERVWQRVGRFGGGGVVENLRLAYELELTADALPTGRVITRARMRARARFLRRLEAHR